MHKIEKVECFKNCTKLCKPHESNKAVWEIYKNFDDKTKNELLEQQEVIKKKLKHPEFI